MATLFLSFSGTLQLYLWLTMCILIEVNGTPSDMDESFGRFVQSMYVFSLYGGSLGSQYCL